MSVADKLRHGGIRANPYSAEGDWFSNDFEVIRQDASIWYSLKTCGDLLATATCQRELQEMVGFKDSDLS